MIVAGLVKRTHRVIQIARQLRHRARTHHFFRQQRHHPPHRAPADPAQKRLPDQHRHLLGPPLETLDFMRQKTLLPGSRHAQSKRPEARHEIASVVAVAIPSLLPLLRSYRPQPEKRSRCRCHSSFRNPCQACLVCPYTSPQELSCIPQKMLEMLGDWDYLRHRV